VSEEQSVERDAHRIVAEQPQAGAARRYTCACGEPLIAHPDVLDEAFAFHLTRVTSPERTDQ
jgi:hypothetical protein